MPRYVKVALWIFGGFVFTAVLCVALLSFFNWNYARPWVDQRLSQAAGRPVAIQGDLDIDWQRPRALPGWRGWVPWPRISADQVVVGNPPGASQDVDMARAKRIAILLNPLALLKHTVQVAELELDTADVQLSQDAQGKNNWTFQKNEQAPPSKWKFELQKVMLRQVRVRVLNPSSDLDVATELNSLKERSAEGYGLGWKTTGRYNKADVSGEGRSGGVLSLQQGGEPFPLQGEIKVGETTIALEGSVTRPQALASLDVRLKLAGSTMADLYPLLGVNLPNTPAYTTEGRLIGVLDSDVKTWTYQDFIGTVGSSDLEGTLQYVMRQPRPLLTGKVESKLLRFADLGPLIGVPSADGEGKPRFKQPAGKTLPAAPFDTQSWGRMDADVQFAGRKILRNKDLPLDEIRAHVKLVDSILTLEPLNFGVAGGDLASNIELNGKGAEINARMSISARHLKLKKLFPAAETMKASFGELHGDAALSGRGNSIASLLGHSNGELKALVSRGAISHLLLETAGLNVANIVFLKLFGDKQVILNCMAADFDIKDGVMAARIFKLETEDAIVDVSGQVSLAKERFALDVHPENKSLRIFTLRTPLYVKGTFKNPDVGVYKGPLAARAGAAVLLGAIATPFAALLPLLNTGTDESNDCAPLLAAVSDKPEAPPPGVIKKESPRETNAVKKSSRGKEAATSPSGSGANTATPAEKRKAARNIP